MADFKTQQELHYWLSSGHNRRVKSICTGTEVGYKDSILWDFTNNFSYSHTFRCPENWRKVEPKVLYVKTMAQLLEEYPEHLFNPRGDLDLQPEMPESCWVIDHSNFQYLGRKASEVLKKWPHHLLEER